MICYSRCFNAQKGRQSGELSVFVKLDGEEMYNIRSTTRFSLFLSPPWTPAGAYWLIVSGLTSLGWIWMW